MTAIDWLARTLLLVLAALATLALIGSLASVSGSPIGAAFPGAIEDAAAPADARTGAPIADVTVVRAPDGSQRIDPTTERTVSPMPTPKREAETARWLKALTYALIALTALVAAAVVAMVRIATQLRRIADR